MPQRLFKKHLPYVKCEDTDVSLSTYAGEKLKVLIKAIVKVDDTSKRVILPVIVQVFRNFQHSSSIIIKEQRLQRMKTAGMPQLRSHLEEVTTDSTMPMQTVKPTTQPPGTLPDEVPTSSEAFLLQRSARAR